MTPGEYEAKRTSLAQALRDLRHTSELSGMTLAKKVGISQSVLSRYERGERLAPPKVVSAWARATSTDAGRTRALVDLAASLAKETRAWRDAHNNGFAAHQKEIQELESSVGVIRIFQQSIIPGLLQTADYARQMLTLAFPEHATDEAIEARMKRQAVLYNRSKRCEFVITDWALRARVCDADTLRAQWEALLSFSTLPNVDIRILVPDMQLAIVPSTTFVMFGDQMVIVEELTNETFVRDEEAIGRYRDAFATLQGCGLSQEDSRQYIRKLLGAEVVDVAGKAQSLAVGV